MKSFLIASSILMFAAAVPAQQVRNVSDKTDVPRPQSNTGAAPAKMEDARLTEASLHMAKKEYAEAAVIFRQLVKENPKDPSLWGQLASADEQLSQSPNDDYINESVRCYEKAIKFDKTNSTLWNNLGTAYNGQRKYSKAIRSYRKAIELEKTNAAYYSNLGMAYLRTKRLEEAQAAFHEALALDPEVFTRSARTGTILRDPNFSDHGMFYFLLAKSFATDGNAERCVYYLRKSRDEGYTDIPKVKDDPAFARVSNDPHFRDLVGLPALPAVQPKSQGLL
jgi:tetratricopeptide (TPR) repeat protein